MPISPRPFYFVVQMSLWGLAAGTLVVSLPWPFLLPLTIFFAGVPGLLAGALLGVKYRSRLIPERFWLRARSGAGAGAVAAGGCYAIVALVVQTVLPWATFCFGVLGSTALGACVGAVAFAALMPASLKGFGLPTPSPDGLG